MNLGEAESQITDMKPVLFLVLTAAVAPAANIYVSPAGRDSNLGTKDRPLASLAAAQRMARSRKSSGAVTVWLRDGTYYLPQRLSSPPRIRARRRCR